MTPLSLSQDWDAHQRYATRFYDHPRAIALWQGFVRMLVSRTNTVSGLRYSADPTILAWQLANEPRPLGRVAAYSRWIEGAVELIHSLDGNHMISLGSEGPTPWPEYVQSDLQRDHRLIDYVTIHVWPQNWNWYDPTGQGKSLEHAWSQARCTLLSALVSMALCQPSPNLGAAHTC